jgi:hypothetical protein
VKRNKKIQKMLKKSSSNSKNSLGTVGAVSNVKSNRNQNVNDDNDDIVVSSNRSSTKSTVKLDANFPIASNLLTEKSAQKSIASKQRKVLAQERWTILKKVCSPVKNDFFLDYQF